MTQPRAYSQTTTFNDHSTVAPSDPHSGANLDTEFVELKQNLDDVNTNLALLQRDDGKLLNTAVHKDAFDQDALALIGASGSGFAPKGVWTNLKSTVAITTWASDGGSPAKSILTKAEHGLADNTVVRLTTSTTLPTGFVSTADYYVVSSTTDTFKLSATSSGTPINFSNAGSGTHSYSFPNTYASGDLVTNNAASYLTVSAHTSGSTFAGDSTYWTLIANSAIETTSASIDMHNGNGTNKVFTTTYTYTAVGDIQVFVNGALQATNLYTITNTGGGNNITFTAPTSAPSSGTNNVIIWGATVVAEAAKAGALTYSATAENHRTTADRFANLVTGSVTDAESGATNQGFSSKAYAIGGTGVTQTALLGASKEWAIGTGRIDHQTTGGYSSKEHAQGTTVATGSSKQWALGGGSFVEATAVEGTNYSAKRYASLAAADLVLTNADVVSAEADKVQTGLDRVATAADKVATNADVVLTNADVVLAEADKVQTGLDRVATAADVVSAEADKVQTGLDRIATAADVVLTNADVVLTHADEVLTRADTVLTAADVVSSASSATASAASASISEGVAVSMAIALG